MHKLLLGAVVLFALVGCGGGNACEELKKKMCEGKPAEACKAMGSFLDNMMKGPNGETLTGDQANQVCKMVLEDKDALKGWADNAKEK